ncbi:MAG: glycosyltransferase family 4 protein [Clostridiales bacterium]|nr:glycosyltransferase family 4 protein [Clostridiales bacterium]
MKIVILTPTLYDEKSPFNHLFKDILQSFIDSGHEVIRIVACEDIDNYVKLVEAGNISYIPIKRKKVEKSNIIFRYINDVLTNIRMARKIKKIKNADVLFEDVGYSSYWSVKVAKKKKLKVVSMLQDVWPDNAVSSGLIEENGFIYKFFESFQKKVYKKSDRIICISDTMKDFIVSKGVDENKVQVIYNWGYGDSPIKISFEENVFALQNNLSKEKFYVVYAGNIGRMQNVELVVDSAEILKDSKKIQFLIIGDGVNKEKIELMVKEKHLENVMLMPMQPSSLAESIYSIANINVIPLVDGGIKTALPSKTGVVLSCGRPVFFCFGESGTFSEKVKKFDGVESLSSTSAEELANKILEYSNKENLICNSEKWFEEDFTRKDNILKYLKSVEF